MTRLECTSPVEICPIKMKLFRLFPVQDVMIKVMNWVVEEKKHIRFYHEWNDKEVCVCRSKVLTGILNTEPLTENQKATSLFSHPM